MVMMHGAYIVLRLVTVKHNAKDIMHIAVGKKQFQFQVVPLPQPAQIHVLVTELEKRSLGYTGTDCSLKICPLNCSNQGTCNQTTGTCTCNTGFTGTNCSLKLCPQNCSSHGTCNQTTGVCNCLSGYGGRDCSLIVCPNNCSNQGICDTITGICTCNAGYSSSDCSLKNCLNNCSGNGTCNYTSGSCNCNTGYSGADCSIQITLSCPNNCSYNGQCNSSTGICACNAGFFGNDCSLTFKQDHMIYLLTWVAWNPTDMLEQFRPACLGLTKLLSLAFGKPTQIDGINYDGQSPSQVVWYKGQSVLAVNVYKDAITGLYQVGGVKTLLSIGGWTYRDNFNFLATLNSSQINDWAVKVKSIVDSFGAHGIDIDYENDTSTQWYNVLVKNNVIGILRQVMPSPNYIIKVSLLYGAAMNYSTVYNLYSPPLNGQWAIGVAKDLIIQNWNDVDQFGIQSYSNDPNMNPMTTVDLNKQSINSYLGISNSEKKLSLGGMIGSQSSSCTTSSWCNWQVSPHAHDAAVYVRNYQIGGMFWWPGAGITNSVAYPYQFESFVDIFGMNPTNLSLSGVC